MVFGKILVVFLIISLKLSAEVCCDSYKCNLITDSGNCTSHTECIYENNLCRDRKCSDNTSNNCESFGNPCKLAGTACVDAPLCSDWSDRPASDCTSHFEINGSSFSTCIVDGSACKKAPVASCSDFTPQGTCDIANAFLGCKWTGSTCVTASSCANFSSTECIGKQIFNGTASTTCILDGTVCKGAKSCADYSGTTNPSCSSVGSRCTASGSVCRETKCSDYPLSSCNSGREYSSSSTGSNSPCNWDTASSACKVAVCSDWSTTSQSQCESNGRLSCVYNSSDNTCSAFTCGSLNDGSLCDSTGLDSCYWLSSCPVKDNGGGGSASGIFAPALLVSLLLVLFW